MPRPSRFAPGSLLHRRLEDLYRAFDASCVDLDPLAVVREHRGRDDQEVAGLVAAGLAFGGVETILRSVRAALQPLGEHPAEGLAHSTDREIRKALRNFRHRWVNGDDVAALYSAARRIRNEHGTLNAAFLDGDAGGETVEPGLESLARRLRSSDPGFARRGARAFFPAPSDGSACKRPALYLRWMVRDDGIDTGAWKGVDPARLVLPLDTHVERIARGLGILRRKTNGWGAVLEATAKLRRMCPEDPIRYDFAICRLGVLKVYRSRPNLQDIERESMVAAMLREGSETLPSQRAVARRTLGGSLSRSGAALGLPPTSRPSAAS